VLASPDSHVGQRKSKKEVPKKGHKAPESLRKITCDRNEMSRNKESNGEIQDIFGEKGGIGE